jgi:outer membrane protein assembly factor BamB
MAPSFVPGRTADTPGGCDIVVVGQKNGIVYAFDAANGTVLWETVVAPDPGPTGALNYGLAVDDTGVYFSVLNPLYAAWTLALSGRNIYNSAYGSLNLHNGSIAWEVPVPDNSTNYASPTVANDLVLVGRTGTYDTGTVTAPAGTKGGLVFLEKSTGMAIGELGVDTTMWGGVAVQGNWVMFGSGYEAAIGNGSFYVYRVSSGNGTHYWT